MLLELVGHEGRITRCAWGPLNRALLSAGEDGSVRLWDVEVRSSAAGGLGGSFACALALDAHALLLSADGQAAG